MFVGAAGCGASFPLLFPPKPNSSLDRESASSSFLRSLRRARRGRVSAGGSLPPRLLAAVVDAVGARVPASPKAVLGGAQQPWGARGRNVFA